VAWGHWLVFFAGTDDTGPFDDLYLYAAQTDARARDAVSSVRRYDTWEKTWRRLEVPADQPRPAARFFHSYVATFASVQPFSIEGNGRAVMLDEGRMVVYGGRGRDGGVLGDLWLLDLSACPPRWTPLTTTGPAPLPRAGHSMTLFDHHIIIFGTRAP
jgi:hypothetical protein